MSENLYEKMLKQLSKRALEGRRWRVNARQKRKFNTIVSKYVEENHKDIYERCKVFFDNVVDKYPACQNLTKTEEFRFFLAPKTSQETVAETVAENCDESALQEETAASGIAGVSNNYEAAEELCQEETAAVEDVTVTPGNTYVENDVIINEYIVNNNRT